MRLLFWHPIYSRIRAWFGVGTPTARPAIWLGTIDASPVFLGKMDAALPLGVLAPEAALSPLCLGFMDGNLSLGVMDAGAEKLGTMQGAPIRLGKMPVRRGS